MNLAGFLSVYQTGLDSNCSIILKFSDPVADDEKLNLLSERQRALNEFLSKEDIDSQENKFARTCLLHLQLYFEKNASKPVEDLKESEAKSEPKARSDFNSSEVSP
jgi:hypothetical protein